MGHHPTPDELRGWFAGRLPDAWFSGTPDVSVDREEILVIGELVVPDLGADATDAARAAARTSRVERFRDETREEIGCGSRRTPSSASPRIVSWGVRMGDETFSSRRQHSVMTRCASRAARPRHPRGAGGRPAAGATRCLVREARR